MAYNLIITHRFKKNAKLCKKRGLPMEDLWKVVQILVEKGRLPDSYLPHPLSGKYVGHMECHIHPDWLLIWKQDNKNLILYLTSTGTHSDLY